MYIKQNLTTRSKNLGYLTRITEIETSESFLVVSKFKGKDPTPEIENQFKKVHAFIDSEYDNNISLYDVRIDNNLYLELMDQEWDGKYVVNLEKELSNPFETEVQVQETT